MKNLTSTLGIFIAAGLTLTAIAIVSAADAQVYTKTGVVSEETAASAGSAPIYTKGGVVTHPQTTMSVGTVTHSAPLAPASTGSQIQLADGTVMSITQYVALQNARNAHAATAQTAPPTFATSTSTAPAAIALGPVSNAAIRSMAATGLAGSTAIGAGLGPSAPANSVAIAPMRQVTQQPSSIAANTGAQCSQGRQALAFTNPTINFRGVNYSYTPTPPLTFNGGAAIAAIYPSLSGQTQICYSGACINGQAGSCAAIAVAQPDGRTRIYVKS